MIECYDALVLAGGAARRMGGRDKGLQPWGGTLLIERAVEILKRQAPMPVRVIISANRNGSIYARFGDRVVADATPGFAGPLAGVEAGLQSAQCDWVLCLPCDMPQLPHDLAARLAAAVRQGAPAAYASTVGGPQPVCCLLPRAWSTLAGAALNEGHGQVLRWLREHGAVPVHFDDTGAFANCNTVDELDFNLEARP